MDDILILSIESSCDETAAAVTLNGRQVLSSVISSQADIHKKFGGVVPEVASRNHTLSINGAVERALEDAGKSFKDLNAVAVTYGAGLAGALLVGVSYAKAMAYALGIPLIAVNHIKGHIAANYIAHGELEPPFICLVASGGHTAVLEVISHTEHRLLGQTVDDAVGEAFDKVARLLGLGYPGGPLIDKAAKEGRPAIDFPPPLAGGYNFSYSGLKTAVINYVHGLEQKGIEINVPDVCASFQKAAIDALVEKAVKACGDFGYDKLCLAGGVAANSYLRESAASRCEKEGIKLYFPPLWLCTDNAAMIGAEGYYNFISGKNIADFSLNAVPHLKL